MSNERMKVLQMIADGTITPEEGEQLLNRMEPAQATSADAEPEANTGDRKSGPFKYVRVVVDGKDKANVRIPIGLIRTGIKLSTLVPIVASENLTAHGIDLSQFNDLHGDGLLEALEELSVNVDSDDGSTVRIFCE